MLSKNPAKSVSQVRITRLSQIHGQKQVIQLLEMNLHAYRHQQAQDRQSLPDFGPVLFTGPSGVGKTLVARVLHQELHHQQLFEVNGEILNSKQVLFNVLLKATDKTTIFIDEAQALNRKAQHILLTALSEKKIYCGDSGSYLDSFSISLANFVIILATTHEYQLQDALRNRIRIYCRFELYSVPELMDIIGYYCRELAWNYASEAVLALIAQRAKGIARLAVNKYLQMSHSVALSRLHDEITTADVHEAFRLQQIDALGLDRTDREYLRVLWQEGRSPLGVLSAKLSLPPLTLRRVVEPFLLRQNLISKDSSNRRVITDKGKMHLREIGEE